MAVAPGDGPAAMMGITWIVCLTTDDQGAAAAPVPMAERPAITTSHTPAWPSDEQAAFPGGEGGAGPASWSWGPSSMAADDEHRLVVDGATIAEDAVKMDIEVLRPCGLTCRGT